MAYPEPGPFLVSTVVQTGAAPSYPNQSKAAPSADPDGSIWVKITGGGGSGGTASSYGVAFPIIGTAVGVKDNAGNMVPITLDATGKLPVSGSLAVTPTQSNTSSAPAQVAVGTSAVQLLAANVNRKRLRIQNTGTTRIKLSFGAVNPTATVYHRCLPACGSADDGSSAPVEDQIWTGSVQAIGSAAGGTVVIEEDT